MLAAAAALTIATGIQLWYLAVIRVGRPSTGSAETADRPSQEMVTGLFPLAYSNIPMTGGRVVRLEIRPETLVALGLDTSRLDGDSSAQLILGDVIVGDDGLARAVRFVRRSTRGIGNKEGLR